PQGAGEARARGAHAARRRRHAPPQPPRHRPARSHRRIGVRAATARRRAPRGCVHLSRRRGALGEGRRTRDGGRGKGGGGARAADGARNAARPGLRPPRRSRPHSVGDVGPPGALRSPAARQRGETVTLTDAALTLGGALVAGAAALWAGLVAPELAATALPLARRTLAPFGPLLWLLAWVDKGLHGLVATPRPLEPDLGAAQRDMLLGVFTLADTRVDEDMTPRLDMVAVDLA